MITLISINKNDVIDKIDYSFNQTSFGKVLIASTHLGICYLTFIEEENDPLKELKKQFPHCDLHLEANAMHQMAILLLLNQQTDKTKITLHVRGTAFQIRVWNLLLEIPYGATATYNQLAALIKMTNGARAVGTAVGKNPIAYLIPCHRVIGSNGQLSGYRWGLKRKALMLEHEADKSLRLF